jgi:chromosome segregation protein
LSQLAEQTRAARSEQIAADLAEVEAQLRELQERKCHWRRLASKNSTCSWRTSQERHAQLDEQVIAAERKPGGLPGTAAQLLERQAQDGGLCASAAWWRARPNWPAPLKPPRSRRAASESDEQRAKDELARLTDAAAQAGLQDALALKLEREAQLGAQRSAYDDLTARLRASDERRLKLERELDPMRQRITDLQLKEQAARLGLEQYTQLLADARG